MKHKQQEQNGLPGAVVVKKVYNPPSLINLGDVRDLTLAPSPGTTESGRGPGFRGGPLDPTF